MMTAAIVAAVPRNVMAPPVVLASSPAFTRTARCIASRGSHPTRNATSSSADGTTAVYRRRRFADSIFAAGLPEHHHWQIATGGERWQRGASPCERNEQA